jgi:hypothetical protein
MSKKDLEVGGYLSPVYIEFGLGKEPLRTVQVNVDTFESCFPSLQPFVIDNSPKRISGDFCSVYGSVGRNVVMGGGFAYVNSDEPPISRTLMGYIPSKTLAERLPKAFGELKRLEQIGK